jgi:hypothetical protein
MGGQQNNNPRHLSYLVAGVIAAVVVIAGIFAFYYSHASASESTSTATTISSSSSSNQKLIILYVNQGNALVDTSNFSSLLNFAKSQHFNTIFFQIYRSGDLLFSLGDLEQFVKEAKQSNLSIYFSLYFTQTTQEIPSSIYTLGEAGINLDMSTLSISAQTALLATLSEGYREGKTSVTTTNFQTVLKPDLLILETYDSPADNQYIRPGIIGSVEPLAISSAEEYQQEYEYALNNSNGVMVFDYYGLLQTGY